MKVELDLTQKALLKLLLISKTIDKTPEESIEFLCNYYRNNIINQSDEELDILLNTDNA